IEHPRGLSLTDYAHRMARTVVPGTPDRPLVIAGLSFGGMVGLEMARPLRAAKVILIPSPGPGRSVPPLVSPIQRIVPRLPSLTYRIARVLMPPMLYLAYHRGDPEGSDRIVEVLRHHLDYPTWREGIGSIRDWQLSADPPCPVKAIHGSHDRLIPLARIERPDVIVPGASHLLNLTHPTAVNAFLRDELVKSRG
ncbi:MAG TPA: alpha/beta hydrolase, partial [Tepidisphaeraceae bacterium]|nr:alpha/beta hydrolase [Tepidisphaeraceae bacterium]